MTMYEATMYGVKTRQQLRSAIVVCFSIVLLGALLLIFGCAYRNTATGKQPATNFEQILAWNAAAAQANDGFASNVIGLQQAGVLPIADARTILTAEAKIAEADKRITDRISAAAACGAEQAGTTATSAQLDSASAACAQISASGIAADVTLILGTIGDLNNTGLLAVKDAAKRQALSDLLAGIQVLVQKIYSTLEAVGVLK
jgi:hypothetical protein